jgi:hypothetical protein
MLERFYRLTARKGKPYAIAVCNGRVRAMVTSQRQHSAKAVKKRRLRVSA